MSTRVIVESGPGGNTAVVKMTSIDLSRERLLTTPPWSLLTDIEMRSYGCVLLVGLRDRLNSKSLSVDSL